MRLVSADEAARRLGVRKETLYTYASRGWLRAIREGRRSRYPEEDVRALELRAASAGGHGAAAADAMDWGAPILESAITSIDVDGPNYRGVPALTLAERDTPFEQVAALLWEDARPFTPEPASDGSFLDPLPAGTPVGRVLAAAALAGSLRDDPAREEPERWRALVRQLAAAVSALGPAPRERFGAAGRAPTVAGAIRVGLGLAPAADRWIDRALVCCADHELNASAFAARVAAGTGADAWACVGAALATWSGPRHGGATDRTEAWVADPTDGVRERLARGADLPGFGHRLYPLGDPRGALLLEDAAALAPDAVAPLLALADQVREAVGELPTVDLGLVAMGRALGLPRGAAAALFAVGRSVGWLAHVAEQRASGRMLRPRAVYRGR